MLKKLLFFLVLTSLTGCGILSAFSPAPTRFPQFNEHALTSAGSYSSPQWSPDSRYLAYLDTTHDAALMVYDTTDKVTWSVATNVSTGHFSWTPDSHLTYLRDRLDLSGSPFPMIYDLHQVDLDGANDQVIAPALANVGDFAWFSDGINLMILLTKPKSRTSYKNVYLLNKSTNKVELLLEAEEIGLEFIVSVALSPDQKSILVDGISELVEGRATASSGKFVLYDLETRRILQQVTLSEVMGSDDEDMTYLWPVIAAATNAGWVGGQRWYLADANIPNADSVCYNYALYFFDLEDLQNSFCIPSEGVIDGPVISPDLKKISYVTIVSPGNSYLILGTVPPDLINRLEVDR